LLLCVMLWAVPGEDASLIEYEDRVLERVPVHGGEVLSRVRTLEGADREDAPLEIHLLRFPSQQALDAYMGDPQRSRLASLRERSISHTQVLQVGQVSG
jgi:uncharacterized protein (DUF1330 family)